jgi:molecular chaperone IbpA
MRTMIDVAPMWRSGIGFDRMLDLVDDAVRFEATGNYPPYNVEKTGEETYRISLAVAGFAPDDLTITARPNLLEVTGKKGEAQGGQFLYQGIAARAFHRQFSLADDVKVVGARLENGLLTIDLKREVPEAMKPRRIEIVNSNQQQAIESKEAA